ncbi:MAG: HEAT repeat domain-containing protein, partial [Terriglobales bacterium]
YMLVNLSSAIGRYVKDERAIPSLRVLLGAADVLTRRAAAFALRNTGSELAIPALAIALGDTDSEVRYYAVIGLGEIANQPDWRPLMDDYALGEQKYLQYWRAWAAANGVQPK